MNEQGLVEFLEAKGYPISDPDEVGELAAILQDEGYRIVKIREHDPARGLAAANYTIEDEL